MEREQASLKVGIISPYPLIPDTPDGVKDYVLGLQKVLVQKGVDVVLIGPALSKDFSNEADETLGQSLLRLKTGGTGYPLTTTINLPRAFNILGRNKLNILDMQDPWISPFGTSTIIVARNIMQDEKKPAIVVQLHSYTEDPTVFQQALIVIGGKSGLVKRVSMKTVSERAAVSPDTARLWADILGEDVNLYEVIPNGVDVDKFAEEKGAFRNWQTLKEQGKKIVLATARHDARKGLGYLIMAVAKLINKGERSDILLKLTGRGSETENLKNLVNKLELSQYVEFLGNLPEEELIKAVKNCDLLVAPSTGGEGTNRSILNGRAARRLVVATEIGGQTFAYGDPKVFGEMAKPSNVDSLAKVINDSLELPKEEVDRRTSQGFIDVQRFSWETVGEQKIRQYDRAIEKKNNKPARSKTIYMRG